MHPFSRYSVFLASLNAPGFVLRDSLLSEHVSATVSYSADRHLNPRSRRHSSSQSRRLGTLSNSRSS